ncbi:uncharacterized protein PRCAT00000742001 [Priceomyces carsonii]|uniref:uncharacterized protein n=1 Tax=Priceomyces carsonii TaxID=28549 RepID=UPI002ED81518|nr:unnamed protein product [Priceomyces carsonii]
MSFSIQGSLIDPQGNSSELFDNSKPREERDLAEIYPDLDETKQLKVFVLKDGEDEVNESTTTSKVHLDLKKPRFKLIDNIDGPQNEVRFSKVITDYGFQEPGKISSKTKAETYIRPFSLLNNEKSIEEVLQRSKKQVEYDMDEQDHLYLQHRNQQLKNIIKLTPEVFEIMITTLENEWDKLELRMKSLNTGDDESTSKLYTLDEEQSNDKYGNDDGIVHGSFYEQKCAICNDSDCDNSNAIVFCDGCDIAVHQECYGIAFIPEGQWLCRKCMISKNRQVDCVFCPSHTGAFKQLDNSLWSHVVCALWINELYFANPVYMEPIEGVDLIPKSRWKLTCYICRQRVGACIQCSNKNCFQAYHVTCAKRAGLYMQFTRGLQGAVANKSSLRSYCDRHGPAHWDQGEVVLGIEKTRLFFRDIKILNDQNAKLTKNQKNANKLNIFKWKTENDTPIAPKLFSDILFSTLISLKVEDQFSFSVQSKLAMLRDLGYVPNRSKELVWDEIREISNEICRYWCLKRELKKGAPLIRKNNNLLGTSSILYGNNTLDVINDKIEFASYLVKDLLKVMGLSEHTISRQRISQDINQLDLSMIDTVYFPFKKYIDIIIAELNMRYDKTHVIKNYIPKNQNVVGMKEIINRNAHYQYTSIEAWIGDIRELEAIIFEENKPSVNIYKYFKRWIKEFNSLQHQMIKDQANINNDFQNGRLHLPFIDTSNESFSFREYYPGKVLQENDLSEVEDFPNPEEDNRELQLFLTNRFS